MSQSVLRISSDRRMTIRHLPLVSRIPLLNPQNTRDSKLLSCIDVRLHEALFRIFSGNIL